MRIFVLMKNAIAAMMSSLPKRLALFLILATTLMLVACGEKGKDLIDTEDFPPTLSNLPDMSPIRFPPQETEFAEDLIVILETVNFSATNTQHDVQAVSLVHFVSEELSENQAKMFTYRIVASDLWNPWKDRQARDLYWHEFSKGYLALTAPFRTYFHDFSQESVYAYNVQRVFELQLYRTMVVVKPDGEEVLFQINLLKHEQMVNPQNSDAVENAFKLQDLITSYITKTPEQFAYFIIAADWTGSGAGSAYLNWHFLQGAWYSRDIERVFFPVITGFENSMRLRDLVRIELHPVSEID